jgi:transcriptional regulator with XRE-family HTH domain
MATESLGSRIRTARKQRGLNQDQFAEELKISRDTVWRMEHDGNVQKKNVVAAIRFLGLDEPGLTSDVEPSTRRQALARALLRAYDANEQIARTLDAIAEPHLDEQEGQQPRPAARPDEKVSAGGSRGRGRTAQGRR